MRPTLDYLVPFRYQWTMDCRVTPQTIYQRGWHPDHHDQWLEMETTYALRRKLYPANTGSN